MELAVAVDADERVPALPTPLHVPERPSRQRRRVRADDANLMDGSEDVLVRGHPRSTLGDSLRLIGKRGADGFAVALPAGDVVGYVSANRVSSFVFALADRAGA